MTIEMGDNGQPKGLKCQECSAVKLMQRGICELCMTKHVELYQTGEDKRCEQCWLKLIAFNRT